MKTITFLLTGILMLGCSKGRNSSIPDLYSHRDSVQYTFRLIDRIALEEPDSIFVGKMISFAVFPDGRMSVGDQLDGSVKIFSPDGKYLKSISKKGDGHGQTIQLVWHCIDDAGRVWISDDMKSRISVYDTNGVYQHDWNPLDHCEDCAFYPGLIRVVGNRLYAGITKGFTGVKTSDDISSLVSEYEIRESSLAHIADYGKYEHVVEEMKLVVCYSVFAIDSSGNVYFNHDDTDIIQKFAPDGRMTKRFHYPVPAYHTITTPRPKSRQWENRNSWYWAHSVAGAMSVSGKYVFLSFTNPDPEYVTSHWNRKYRHDYLQVFDLGGNCLAPYLPLPGEFWCTDASGILYLRENSDSESTFILKYQFTVLGK